MNQKGKSLSFVKDSLQSFIKERYNTKEDVSLEEIIFFLELQVIRKCLMLKEEIWSGKNNYDSGENSMEEGSSHRDESTWE